VNQHPAHTSEYLAQQCLDAARGDYALARDLILAYEAGERRGHAVAALAIWAALGPVLTQTTMNPIMAGFANCSTRFDRAQKGENAWQVRGHGPTQATARLAAAFGKRMAASDACRTDN